MDCQGCGSRDALIHLTEIKDGEVVNLWLCPACAGQRQTTNGSFNVENEPVKDLLNTLGPEKPPSRSLADAMAQFLGEEGLQRQNLDPAGLRVCPDCGFKVETFLRKMLLGCPGCYQAFDANIRPVLTRLQGRAIHLGKVPATGAPGVSTLAEMTRTRVALEKAVAEEDFEEAAQLRDTLKELQDKRQREGGLQ